MSGRFPYSTADVAKLAEDARASVERGKPEDLLETCRVLLPWTGQDEADRTLGKVLRLVLRHVPAGKVAEIEADIFTVERLAAGWNPENASIAYLDWKYRQTFRPECAPDLAQAKGLAAAAEALWPHVEDPVRSLHALHVKLAATYGALGNVHALRELGMELLKDTRDDEQKQKSLVRVFKSLQRLQAVAEIDSLLERILTLPHITPAIVEAALTAVAALQASANRLSDFQRLERFLRRLIQWLQPGSKGLCDGRLVNALLRCAAFDQLYRIVPHLVAGIDQLDVRKTLVGALEQLLRYDVLGDAGQHIEQVYRMDPGDPRAAMLLARYLADQGAPHAEIEAVFENLRQESPYYDDAVLWRARHHYHLVQHAKLFQWLNEHPMHDPEKARSLLNRVHAARERLPFPAFVSESDGNRLALTALGPFAPVLTPLVTAINGDFSSAALPPLGNLQSGLRTVELAVLNALQCSSDMTLSGCLDIGRELLRVAGKLSYVAAKGLRRSNLDVPDWGGPQHGRVRAISETLHHVAMQLFKHVLEAGLKDCPISDVRQLCQAADMHLSSSFAVGEPETSTMLLELLHTRQISSPVILRLLERCALQRGDLRSAEHYAAGQISSTGTVYGLAGFNTWVRMEASQAQVLLEQEPKRGIFDYINPQGIHATSPHETPATRVELVHLQGLRMRDIEILIGSKGTIARPDSTHARDLYGYPRNSGMRLNYGYKGCRLENAKDQLHVREPVVALANMDGPYWRNYYHWMLFILTRVAVLLDRGLLDQRRLLLPMELSEWMMTSLALIGLPQERMLRYRGDQEVLVDDAWVVGSVEWAAAGLMKPLQRRLWKAAGVDPGGAGTRAVWLSRRQEPQRYLANTDAIEDLARQMGFYVVNPGTLSLLDQVRLCAGANIIAGPEGSNFTNLLFARPGTRVLTLMVAGGGGDYETWLDMCVMGELPQRWIFGREDPRKAWWGFHFEPYEIDLAILERELNRLMSER